MIKEVTVTKTIEVCDRCSKELPQAITWDELWEGIIMAVSAGEKYNFLSNNRRFNLLDKIFCSEECRFKFKNNCHCGA